MREVEAEVDRILTLLRNTIRERGFTQLEVQDALGWGRSYISQLLTKQKSLRVEQVLLILQVIVVDPAAFFGELYAKPGAGDGAPRPRGNLRFELVPKPAPPSGEEREFEKMVEMLRGLVGALAEKRILTPDELKAAAEAAETEDDQARAG